MFVYVTNIPLSAAAGPSKPSTRRVGVLAGMVHQPAVCSSIALGTEGTVGETQWSAKSGNYIIHLN